MRDLPPPLPRAERTVGQVIGESIRAYGAHFWRLLPAGIPLAAADQLAVRHSVLGQLPIFLVAGPFITAAYVHACSVVHRVRPTWTAFLVGLVVYLPFPFLRAVLIFPGVAWFAYIGLAVPASLIEGLPLRASLTRGRQLGRADCIHSFGSLAALVVVVGIAEYTLQLLLHTQSGNSYRGALLLADLVLTPLLHIGGAMLYHDQAARVGSGHADLHPALEADAAGRADPEGQP